MANQGLIGRIRETPTTAGNESHYVRVFAAPLSTVRALYHETFPSSPTLRMLVGMHYVRAQYNAWQLATNALMGQVKLMDTRILRMPTFQTGVPGGTWAADGTITGVVKENNVAVGAGVVVALLYRTPVPTMVAWTKTDASGRYKFAGLDPLHKEYLVVAFDPDGGVQYNAGRLDRMTPGVVLTGQVLTAAAGLLGPQRY